jgi:hypothetical protein
MAADFIQAVEMPEFAPGRRAERQRKKSHR